MGRNTWECINPNIRPLNKRANIVLSKSQTRINGDCIKKNNFESALQYCTDNDIDDIYVIGGGQLYAETIIHPKLEKLYLTYIDGDFDCDVHFPNVNHLNLISQSDFQTEVNVFDDQLYQYCYNEYVPH